MNERASLLELLRLLVAAGLIDAKVLVRDDDRDLDVQAHVHAVDVREPPRRRYLVSV